MSKSKSKRNQPCPCGSGRKYKYCHGASAPAANYQLINDELNRIHQRLISFSFSKFGNRINKHIRLFPKSFSHDNDETENIYNAGLTLWIILNVPLLENSRTIFDTFYKKNKSSFSQQAKRIFCEWSNKSPSIYEITSIDQPSKQVLVNDILTKEAFTIPYNEQNILIKGSLIIGTLVPFHGHYNFFYTMIKLYHHDKDTLSTLLKNYSEKNNSVIEYFPDLLASALMLGIDANNWNEESHQRVAQLFAEHMVENNYNDETILKGISLWNQYCDREHPSIKKISSYAAALEYLIVSAINKEAITQGKLAKDYGTSPGTVSTNFRKLSTVLKDVIEKS